MSCKSGGPCLVPTPLFPWHCAQLALNATLPATATGDSVGTATLTVAAPPPVSSKLDARSPSPPAITARTTSFGIFSASFVHSSPLLSGTAAPTWLSELDLRQGQALAADLLRRRDDLRGAAYLLLAILVDDTAVEGDAALGLVFGSRVDNDRDGIAQTDRTSAIEGLADVDGAGTWQLRSEEHTSEFQSLMRISYDAFCLQKNNNKIA